MTPPSEQGSETWVLMEPFESKRQGRPVWFKRMTPIGPMATTKPENRAEFPSKEAAMDSPAWLHSEGSLYKAVRA
jgi:hypothetical protein